MNQHKHNHHTIGHSMFSIGVFMLLFLVTIFNPLNSSFIKAIGVDVIINKTNEARTRYDAPVLSVNSSLMSAAQAKAEHMAANQYFAHFAPDGTTPWDFFKESGYNYKVAGENLAITNEDENAVIEGWLNSPTHRENLLSSKYNEFGIGMATYGDYQGNKNTVVIVALYGSQSQSLVVTGTEPTNPAGTIAVLRPSIVGNKLYTLIGIGIALIIAGAALEIRHIKRLKPLLH